MKRFLQKMNCSNNEQNQLPAKKESSKLFEKQDLINMTILVAIALVIGVYLIVTTVMISKDGVFYIKCAQQLTNNPIKIIKAIPPGYPFLILVAHKCTSLFTDDSSVFTWIYSAQSVTLFCRLLALIPLYFMGKLFVGSRNSFWGLLILILLPYPAKFVCDLVREWLYLLFLATGFFFLLWSTKYGKWRAFGLVGLSSGLGYLIRPESAQLVVYGLLWVVMSVFRPKSWDVSRWKNLFALALLFIGFAIPAAPYMKYEGRIIPSRFDSFIKSISSNDSRDKTDAPSVFAFGSEYNTAKIIPSTVLNALGEIFKTIGENLMWFFLPALMIGLHYRFRANAKREELFLITTFALVSVTMMILRYYYCELTVSKRWSLPLIAFTFFYIPVGLQIIGNWLDKNVSYTKQKDNVNEKRLSWFVILFLIGASICIPKLLKPVRIEKQGYRDAAKWLKENTAAADIIAVPDVRFCFYAERKELIYENTVPEQAKYVVRIVKDQNERAESGRTVQEKFSVWMNRREKKKKIVIYEVF